MPKRRADELLVQRGVFATSAEAAARIMAGQVMSTDARGREHKVSTAGEQLDAAATFRLIGERSHPYVSRGGVKLAAALDAFGIDPAGLVCADFGISTGGFTDCLLQRRAARVYGVDVGYGQVAWKIQNDPRAVIRERTNARDLQPGAFAEPAALAVADLSFISLDKVWRAIACQLAPGASVVALVKPQFEAAPGEVPEGGIVTDPVVRRAAIDRAIRSAAEHGLLFAGEIESPISGADGNREHLVWLRNQR